MSKDLRQSGKYAKYMEGIGWEVQTIDDVYFYTRDLFIFKFVKLQRPQILICFEKIRKLFKGFKPLFVVVEPSGKEQQRYYEKSSFKTTKPFLPTKTIHLDLDKSDKTLLSEMHKKSRYNIRLSGRRGVKVRESDDIKKFNDLWHESAKERGMKFSLRREINALYNAFGKDTMILLARKNKRTLGGILLVTAEKATYYMYAATPKRGYKDFAPNLLVWESIKYAKSVGSKLFDFEGIYDKRFPLKKWKGFTRFKKGFGGEVVKYPAALRKLILPF